MRQGRPKKAPPASKVSQEGPKRGPPGATFAHIGGTFGYLGHSFARFYAFLSGFREHLCIFAENSWKTNEYL